MSIFDKLFQQTSGVRSAAGGVAQNAVKQGKSLASIGRTKIAIATEEDSLKKAYTELGRLFYRDYEAGAEATMEDYQPWIEKVTAAKENIARLNEEIAATRAAMETPAAPAEEPEAPVEDVVEETDFADVAVETAEEATEAVEEAVEETAGEFADAAEQVAEAAAEEPTVGTLFVDTTNTEE